MNELKQRIAMQVAKKYYEEEVGILNLSNEFNLTVKYIKHVIKDYREFVVSFMDLMKLYDLVNLENLLIYKDIDIERNRENFINKVYLLKDQGYFVCLRSVEFILDQAKDKKYMEKFYSDCKVVGTN